MTATAVSGRRHADVVQHRGELQRLGVILGECRANSPGRSARSTTRAVPPREYGSRVSSASASALSVSKNRSCAVVAARAFRRAMAVMRPTASSART